jgi:hypothetical protein
MRLLGSRVLGLLPRASVGGKADYVSGRAHDHTHFRFPGPHGPGNTVLVGTGAYVQVLAGPQTVGAGPGVRSESERPIRVMGRFSDSDLLGLVAYIRSGPGPRYPPGVFGMTVSTDVPIQDIEQQPDGSVWVRLSGDGISGETATVIRRDAVGELEKS